jgi:hypothetical protein
MTKHHRILPIPCKPYSLNWLPERLIVSHYENNYGAAVQSLNAVRDRLAGVESCNLGRRHEVKRHCNSLFAYELRTPRRPN